MNYNYVMIFRKGDDMFSYYNTAKNSRHGFLKRRDVYLQLYVRHENGKVFGRIRCPINPFPFKGECELVSVAVVSKALESFGWEHITTLPSGLQG